MVSTSRRTLDMHRCRGAPPGWRRRQGIGALALMLAPAVSLGAQGIGYTLTPAATHVSWADALGLSKTGLYGGQASIDFDRALSLQGYYFQNGSVTMDPSQIGVPPSFPSSFTSNDLRIKSYGANAVVNIGSGQIIPFLKAGGGVVDFTPDGGQSSKQIAINAGGGFRFSFGSRIFLDFFAEDLMFRADRFALLGPPNPPTTTPIPSDPDKNTTRHNFVAGVGLGIPLGAPYQESAATSQQYAWGLGGASFTIEPMYGHFTFDDPANVSIAAQNMGGIRAGFDLGRYAGISGFYARDWNDGFDTGSQVETWGGEAQFRLATGSGITPFLLAGGGSVQFNNGAVTTTPGTTFTGNKTSFILGGGLAFPLDERLAIQLTARDFMYGAGNGIDSVASPSDLLHNWLFSAGLRFNIGGKSGSVAAKEAQAKAAADRARADSLARVNAEHARRDSILLARALADTIKQPQTTAQPAPRPDTTHVPTAAEFQEMMRDVVRTELSERDRMRTEILAQMALQRTNDVWLAASLRGGAPYPVYPEPVPQAAAVARQPTRSDVRVPTAKNPAPPPPQPRVSGGEVAIPPAAAPSPDSAAAERTAAIQSLRDSIRSDIRAELSGARAAAARQDTIVARLDSITKRLDAVEQKQNAPPPKPPQGKQPGGPQSPQARGIMAQPLTVYTGMSFTPEWQTVFGARYDIGALNPSAPIHFAPEGALGFFGGTTTFMAAGNVLFELPPFGSGFRLHFVGGPGFLWVDDDFHSYDSGLNFILNLGVGFTMRLGTGPGLRPQLFGEYQGVDLFGIDRLLFGVKLGF